LPTGEFSRCNRSEGTVGERVKERGVPGKEGRDARAYVKKEWLSNGCYAQDYV